MQLLNAFSEPTSLFTKLKEKPTFALPFWLLVIGTAAVLYLYYQRVDYNWLVDTILAAEQLKPAEAEVARKGMSQAVMSWGSVISAPIVAALMFALSALYYLLAGKVAGLQHGFRAWFAFSVWSSAPQLLSTAVALLNVLTMTAQTPPEGIYLTHLEPLLVQLPTGHAWRSLISNVDLLSLWAIALAAVGWRNWSNSSWGQAVLVAALPSLGIYAVWALFIVAFK